MENKFSRKIFNSAANSFSKKILMKIVLAFTFTFLVGCSNNNSKGDAANASDSTQMMVQVKVDSIKKETLNETISAYGVTSIRQRYQIISPVSGEIIKFNFYNGDKVAKGETIAFIITKESYAVIKGAKQMLNNAVTDEQKKEAERALQLAEENSNQIKIAAPFTGILINKSKNENEIVNEGELIASLIDKNSIFFIAQVPVASISKVKAGQQVDISFPSIEEKKFNGIVKRIEPGVNTQSQTIPVQIEINNLSAFISDSLYGEASVIINKHKDVFTVPSKAVIHDDENDTYSITLINADSIAYSINVTVGIQKDSVMEVQSEKLKERMKVIVEGNYGLPDSTQVSIQK